MRNGTDKEIQSIRDQTLGLGFIVFTVLLLIAMALAKIYECWKSFRAEHVTKAPVLPFSEDKYRIYKGDRGERIYYENVHSIKAKNASVLTLKRIMKTVYNEGYFPHLDGARIISIPMVGFNNGQKCHDFVPESGMAPGSHFTYQMFGGKVIQVTNYVEDDVNYVAGFCIYIKNNWVSGAAIPERIIEKFLNSPTLPGVARDPPGAGEREDILGGLRAPRTFSTENWTVSRCSRLERDVMTTRISNGSVMHQEWDSIWDKMKICKCEVCSERPDLPPAYSSIDLG